MTEVKRKIPQEYKDLNNFCIDQTVICDGKYFQYLENIDSLLPNKKTSSESFGNPLIFYQNVEDVPHTSKIPKLANILHKSNIKSIVNEYNDDEAESQYLSTPPISFLVLGKPNIGQVEVAKSISKHWKCVNIAPESLIKEEINSNSRAGECISYNLKAGRAVGPEIIVRLLEKRVKSQTAQHRGVIISGFPLVSNKNYIEDPISSESAIFTVQEIFEEILPSEYYIDKSRISVGKHVSQAGEETITEEEVLSAEMNIEVEEVEEEQNTNKKRMKSMMQKSYDIDLGPSNIEIVNKSDNYSDLLNPKSQLQFILKLIGDQPLIIIYLTCDNLDVVSKRENYRFNLLTRQEFYLNPISCDLFTENELNEIVFGGTCCFDMIDGYTRKFIVKLPLNYRSNISSQIRQYKCIVQDYLHNNILEYDPQYLIKIDGRFSTVKMFSDIKIRLKTLGLQYVLIPERAKSVDMNLTVKGTDPDADADNPDDTEDYKPTLEDSFNLLRLNTNGSMYKYQLSNWTFKCPVSLKEGRKIEGKAEYVTKFMNKLYFLSSEESVNKFCRNPRNYLLPTTPNPTCRIWVIGPNKSGKTAISKSLSFLYNCKILDPIILEKNYERLKHIEYIDKLRTAAITEALVCINNTRTKEREEDIEKWKVKSQQLIEEIIRHFYNKKIQKESAESNTINENFKFDLKALNLPDITEMETLVRILKNVKLLMTHLPDKLKEPTEPATVFDPFVQNYVDNVLANAPIPNMSLNIEEKIDMFKTAMQEAEDEFYQTNSARGGWIVDGMPLDLAFIQKLCPEFLADDIICIKDKDPDHKFLLSQFRKRDYSSFKDFDKIFNEIKKYSANKEFNIINDNTSRLKIIDSLLNEIEERAYIKQSEDHFDSNLFESQKSINYFNHIVDFHKNWEAIKRFLISEYNNSPIEVDPTDKSKYEFLKEAVIYIENKYRKIATIMTEEEIQADMHDYTADFPAEIAGEGEGDETEGDFGQSQLNYYKENRRLGASNIYCPVTFERHFVLWKGKEEFAVSYENNLYFLSSISAMNEFVFDPRLYINNKPPDKFPPPRICLIGTTGSGKSSCAKLIAENYGCHYVSFDELILEACNLPGPDLDEIFRNEGFVDPAILTNMQKVTMLKDYIERDIPLNPELLKSILTPLWFHDKYIKAGFILDNFPRRPSDVKVMTSNFFIPDIVIELLVSNDLATNRKFSAGFTHRLNIVNEKRAIMVEENEIKYNKWLEEKYSRMQVLLDEKREHRRKIRLGITDSSRKLTTPVNSGVNLEKIQEIEEHEEEEMYAMDEETYDYSSYDEKEDIDEVNLILSREMPAPIFNIKLPTEDEIIEDLHNTIDTNYNRDIDFYVNLKDNLVEANIDFANVSTNAFNLNQTFYAVSRLTDEIKFRNKSFFERVYEINIDTAERLLTQGYYFISRFGRTCPVQVYENINPIQMFIPGGSDKIFPLVHRRYIYFIYTEENRVKFKENPLLYTNCDKQFPLIPARISIIGPPKSGKSTLSERLKKHFGLQLITRGDAIRHVQEQIRLSELAININRVLRKGWSVTYDMTAKAVETLTLDGIAITQGCIFDGFPNTEEEMKYYVALGLAPHLIIELSINADKMNEYYDESMIPIKMPTTTFSYNYIKFANDQWKRRIGAYRNYIHYEFQNMHMIENMDSKWNLYFKAKSLIFQTMKQFHHYLFKKNLNMVINMAGVCLTPSEFFQRLDLFRDYCPMCWLFHDILENSGKYLDRSKIVQFENYFYFVCDKYRKYFNLNPTNYIPPKQDKVLPEFLPTPVAAEEDQAYYQDGVCIVCFWDNQPVHVINPGCNDFLIKYRNFIYRMCSKECFDKFMSRPTKYAHIIINYRNTKTIDIGDLKNLPTLGYLEQFMSKQVIDAVINVEIERPYQPFLDIAKSAAVHIGMYLKLHNPKTSKENLIMFKDAKENFIYRREKLKKKIEYFKSRVNPFLCLDSMFTEPYKFAKRPIYVDQESSEEEIMVVPYDGHMELYPDKDMYEMYEEDHYIDLKLSISKFL